MNRRCFHIVTGLIRPDEAREAAILQEFWSRFESLQPQHPIFQRARDGWINLSRAAPLLYHGDEGRGRRRQPFLVCSFHSILGRGVRAGLRRQEQLGIQKQFLKMKPNFMGHAYTHRFLQVALTKKIFQNKKVFEAVLENCAAEAEYMQTAGVVHQYTKQRYYAVVLNVTGDWQFLYKAGEMVRSYNNVEKAREAANPQGICHLCHAGKRGHAFECFETRSPSWLSTFCCDVPFEQPASPLLRLLHPPGVQPTIFAFDVWHCFHLGVGKAFAAAALALMSLQFPRRSKDAWMERYLPLSCPGVLKTPPLQF